MPLTGTKSVLRASRRVSVLPSGLRSSRLTQMRHVFAPKPQICPGTFVHPEPARSPVSSMLAAMDETGRPWHTAAAAERSFRRGTFSHSAPDTRIWGSGLEVVNSGIKPTSSPWATCQASGVLGLARSHRRSWLSPSSDRSTRARLSLVGSLLLQKAYTLRPRNTLTQSLRSLEYKPLLSFRANLAAIDGGVHCQRSWSVGSVESQASLGKEQLAAETKEPRHLFFVSSQTALLTSAVAGMGWVMASGWDGLSFWSPGLVLASAPSALLCFGAADLVAQRMQGNTSIDWKRMLAATGIGMLLNGGGFLIWVHYLHILIPTEVVTGGGVSAFMMLSAKALIDSFTWGTVANTIGIILRRLLAGDSLSMAVRLWRQKIWTIFIDEFKFWPMWQAINFYMIPAPLHVSFTALGSFVWNVYMSILSSRAAVSRTKLKV